MRIAYILYPAVIISNKSNGIRSQAETWANQLMEAGHEVVLVNNWGNYDWSSFDVIHIFGSGVWIYDVVNRLSRINANIAWSPILDPDTTRKGKFKDRLRRLFDRFFGMLLRNVIKESVGKVRLIFARSEFEKTYFSWLYSVPSEKMSIIPLSYSTTCQPYNSCEKEDFCLHISSITQDRKNVVSLIKAAKKYDFRLVLAGNKGTKEQYKVIEDAIGGAENIKVLGFITEKEKIDLYKKAKVFALPSKSEGVGIVALDAAYFGCEIAISNIPGPKEYYNGKCIEVDPYSIDSIGKSIKSLLNGDIAFQPLLSQDIKSKYSKEAIISNLIVEYAKMK